MERTTNCPLKFLLEAEIAVGFEEVPAAGLSCGGDRSHNIGGFNQSPVPSTSELLRGHMGGQMSCLSEYLTNMSSSYRGKQ